MLNLTLTEEVLSVVESIQNVMKMHNHDRLTFEIFWSSNMMKGELINEDGQLEETNFVFKPRLNSGQKRYMGSLKSRELKKEFNLFFSFFDYKPTGNLLRDINLFLKVLADDGESNYSIFDVREVSNVQKKLQTRLLRYIFEYYDKNNTGFIEPEELMSFIQDVQEALSEDGDGENLADLVEEMIHDCDADGDGNIGYHEIVPHLPGVFARMRQ